MTLDQNILEAIRTQPENVEWRYYTDGEWIKYSPRDTQELDDIFKAQWRIKPKPYEARHEVYFKSAKDAELFWIGSHITNKTLFGWYDISINKNEQYAKKFEIIVREVVE